MELRHNITQARAFILHEYISMPVMGQGSPYLGVSGGDGRNETCTALPGLPGGLGRPNTVGHPSGIATAPLGILRNFIRSAPQADFQVRPYEGQTFTSAEAADEALVKYGRLRRFALQSAAVAACPGEKRLADCLRKNYASTVDVKYSPTRSSAWYVGLVTCGSVWMCPVCAAKVSERRRVELGTAIKAWRKVGGSCWLVTLTFSHQVHDSLKDLNQRLKGAMRRFQGGAAAKADKSAFEVVGQVRALEVTHGANGWHPHVHQLVFLRGEDTSERRESLRKRLFARWERACRLAGLGLPSEKHGVSVDGHEKAGQYITKWGLESELTKHVSKKARTKSGRTPMGILSDFLDLGDMADADLFAQYARVMKGSSQLVWSRGLRDFLDLAPEKTDEEIAEADEAQVGDHLLAQLSLPIWRLVRKWDVRGQLLAVASSGNPDEFAAYVERLVSLE